MKELLDRVVELWDDVIEFCSENETMVVAAGGGLLLIILAGIFISNRMGSATEVENREYFLEGEYDSMLKKAAADKTEAAEIPQSATDVPEVPEEQPDDLLEMDLDDEELQPVHININIERGQVKIGYDKDGRITCRIENEEAETEPSEAEVAMPDESGEKMVETMDDISGGQTNIVLEKINLIKAAPVKKFGPDNFNTGRSGRVFTEEELRKQIKD